MKTLRMKRENLEENIDNNDNDNNNNNNNNNNDTDDEDDDKMLVSKTSMHHAREGTLKRP